MIKYRNLSYFLMLFIMQKLLPTEFMYSVAFNEKTNTTYYIRQTDPLHLELYAYDSLAQKYTKLLPNYFIPASFRLLPNQDGFSFIQNDTIYIKRFSKRSPKRIEFFEPIYGINSIEWINESLFYFAARQHRHYRIYEGTIDGDLQIIVTNDKSDALYPQKIDNILFYIERDIQNYYRIIQIMYKSDKSKKIIVEKKEPMACLSMISKNRGFFLTYPPIIKPEDVVITFSYYQLIYNKHWNIERLFDFSIPREFFVDNSQCRLYESIIPFLPKYNNENLYFVDIKNNQLQRFQYDLIKKKLFK